MSEAPTLPADYRLIAMEAVDSTNEEAARQARVGASDGTVVWALEQTRARGRRGRSWSAPRGNFMCSILLRPAVPPAVASQLSFATSLAVSDVLASWSPPGANVALKWPNDVLVNGRKASGVLLEASATADGGLAWLVVGVGLNLTHHPADSESPATSLVAEGASPPPVARALEEYCVAFDRWRRLWAREGFAPIREAWTARARDLGGRIRVRLERETFEGRFIGIDAEGALVVESVPGLQRRVAAGDVFPVAS